MACEYSYDDEMGIDWADSGAWRSYHLDTWGNTLEQLRENATISEVGQDGDELNCYGYLDIPNNEVERAFESIVNGLLTGKVKV